MKKLALIVSLITALCVNVFGEEFPPSWFSNKLTFTETEITRKNADGAWVPFIDRTYTACEFVKVTDEIYSLDMARDAAEKKACERLDEYFKDYKIPEGLKAKHVLAGYKYNDSLADGGAYVKVDVTVSTEKVQEKPQVALDEKKEISESSNLARILQYKGKKFTLVDSINFASQESVDAHRIIQSGKGKGYESKSSKTKESFYYPDGILVYDTVVHLENTLLEFNLKNVIKGRKTVIIIRTDAISENKTLELKYNGQRFPANVEHDGRNRWRNAIFEVEEGTIVEYSPKFIFMDCPKPQGIASIWVYQLL